MYSLWATITSDVCPSHEPPTQHPLFLQANILLNAHRKWKHNHYFSEMCWAWATKLHTYCKSIIACCCCGYSFFPSPQLSCKVFYIWAQYGFSSSVIGTSRSLHLWIASLISVAAAGFWGLSEFTAWFGAELLWRSCPNCTTGEFLKF